MHIMPKGGREAYPGLSNEKFFFDTDGDMLELTQVCEHGPGGGLGVEVAARGGGSTTTTSSSSGGC
jgi:hypothetical protein